MNQEKTGKFIALCRKNKKMTQAELAARLGITDRAVSKWENGRSMPDCSIMLELCNILGISVNELLCGEKIDMNDCDRKTEEILLEMAEKEEMQNKRLMMYEMVIGIFATMLFFTFIFVAEFAVENTVVKIILFSLAFPIFIIGIFFALMIETEAGYYECGHCHNKYVPKFSKVFWAMHMGTTRYLRCPQCNRKSWSKKVMKK